MSHDANMSQIIFFNPHQKKMFLMSKLCSFRLYQQNSHWIFYVSISPCGNDSMINFVKCMLRKLKVLGYSFGIKTGCVCFFFFFFFFIFYRNHLLFPLTLTKETPLSKLCNFNHPPQPPQWLLSGMGTWQSVGWKNLAIEQNPGRNSPKDC